MTEISGRDLRTSVRPHRVEAIKSFGFTERQARFLVTVLVHSGVFLERQYCAFAGIAHGQKAYDFLHKLVDRGYATAITPGALHRGRLFHVQYKPLYQAIGEPDNRNRKPAPLGRFVERLMLLDAVLEDRSCTWLGTKQDKRDYFLSTSSLTSLEDWDFPRLVFGQGDEITDRLFPDKLPIGISREHLRYVFVYLVTRDVPNEFRLFLHRHLQLLRSLQYWSIRLLVPRQFRRALRLYERALREELAMPLTMQDAKELEWFFRVRNGTPSVAAPDPDLDVASASKRYDNARFRALRRTWEREGDSAISSAMSHILCDQWKAGKGRVEFVPLRRQYLQLTPLVGVA